MPNSRDNPFEEYYEHLVAILNFNSDNNTAANRAQKGITLMDVKHMLTTKSQNLHAQLWKNMPFITSIGFIEGSTNEMGPRIIL